ncbi:MAG: hypothetical protein ACPGMU_05360, partial [Candidatus Poseidoniaceae archaeon]
MRKAIALVLLIVLGTMPLQTSAQVSIPAVDLHCLNIYEEVYDSGTADENSTDGFLALINSSENEPSANVTCIASNPNSYVERIQIQVDANGLDVQTTGSITLPPNGEESFNISLSVNQNTSPTNRILEITATVVEANGAPPPNVAEDYVEGIVWIVNDDFLISSSIEITEIGPFKSTTDTYTMENGTEYPVLYLKESFHIDAVMTGWDGNPIANKCLNIYVDPDENPIPIITVNTSESGTIEWFSGDPLQNPSLRGVETTGGKLEGIRTIRVAYEPAGGIVGGCDAEPSGNLSTSHDVIEVLTRSRTDLQLKQNWRATGNNSVTDGDTVTGEVVLIRDRSDLAVEGENIGFQFSYTTDGTNWTFDHEEFYLTNVQGSTSFQWIAKFVEHDDCNVSPCNVVWRISAYHLGSLYFAPAGYNITFDVSVLQPVIDSDGDGVEDDEDAFPNDPNETHDDDGDGVGNNTDEFPQDPDEQFDNDGDGVGNNADDFPDNKYASNWSTIYAAVGTFIVLLIGAGVMISRMKQEDELPNVPATNDLAQIEKQIQELERM